MERPALISALALVERPLSDLQWARLERYYRWLRDEAVPAGGIGPGEAAKLEERHLADAVVFASPWRGGRPPTSLVDVGSGVGLPGLVLAILWPDTRVVLLDRSGRRVDLARRAIRVVGLENVEAVQNDALLHGVRYAAAVMRAVYPPTEAIPLMAKLLDSGGLAALALSRRTAPGDEAQMKSVGEAAGCKIWVEERKVLDLPSWMLIMKRS